jgi:serine/threonine protein kinase
LLFTSGAVGTRSYAAPEILSGIRALADSMNSSLRRAKGYSTQQVPNKTLGACVSSYGMVADAFSVGATIRHMVTGVPPSIDVEDFIAERNHPLMKLARSLRKRLLRNNRKRAKKYRTSSDILVDVRDLIHSLTYYDWRRRATVRSVTQHSWIKTSASTSPEVKHGGPIAYLKCGGY